MKKKQGTSRRDFLKTAAVTGAGLGVAGSLASGTTQAQEGGQAAGGAQPAERVPRKA